MRLTNYMRDRARHYLIEKLKGPIEAGLATREGALATRMLQHRYGRDVFERARALPEGWLYPVRSLRLEADVYETFPRVEVGPQRVFCQVSLADYAPLPYSAHAGWSREVLGPTLCAALHDLAVTWAERHTELVALDRQVRATLASFYTVEALAEGWPEGYAELPQELLAQSGGLPAPRIADLNARIAAARQVA